MAKISFDFSGEHVLVTGASRGIGAAVAHGFAAAGARVTVLAETEDVVDTAGRLSSETGQSVEPVLCDITQPDAVRDVIGGLDAVDVLVNNAGIERATPLLEATPESDAAFRKVTDINVVGTYSVTRHVLPLMKDGGRIIMTSSIWGRIGVPEFAAYCASKHAVLGLVRSMAKELGPRGIRVNAVCPGWVRTVQSMATLARMVEVSGRSETDLMEEITSAQVLPGLMEPGDVADTYLYLASPAASNITGQAFVVDRGEVMA